MQVNTTASTYAADLETYKQRYQQLEARNHELEKRIIDYQKKNIELQEYQHKYLELKERYDLLIYKRFCRSAEQLQADPSQLLLFTEGPEQAVAVEAEPEERIEVKPHSRKKCGRKPLDPNLPRVERIIDIPESDKKCTCGALLTRFGEEIKEEFHIIPAQVYVEKTIRPKYVCRSCEGVEEEGIKPTVKIAPVEPSIIPRSIVSPSLLATIIIQKYEDHLPYYRQEI